MVFNPSEQPTDKVADFRNYEPAPAPSQPSVIKENKTALSKHLSPSLIIIGVGMAVLLVIIIWLSIGHNYSSSKIETPSGYQIFQSSSTPPRLEKSN